MNNTLLTLLSADRLQEHYEAGHWRDETIFSLAKQHALKTPGTYAVRDRLRRLAYGELVAHAERLAEELSRTGIRRGQRVAVWLPSRVETVIALLACSRNGYVCCPSLHRDHTVADIVTLLGRMRAAALIVEQGYGADGDRHDIGAALRDLPWLKYLCKLDPMGGGGPEPGPFGTSLETVRSGRARAPENADPNRVVYLAFTSGTTGVPKGVMHSDNTLLANARALAADWKLDAETVIYTLSPLSHNLGFGAMVTSILVGGELVVHDLPRQSSLLDRLVETNATFLFGVPTHAIDLLTEIKRRDVRGIGKVKGFRISGASAPKEVVAGLLDHGVTPQSGYGMTEACSHNYTLPTDEAARILETSGRACPGYEIKIWSQGDPDTEAPIGEIGQIGGRGASLMLGYFDDQATTEESFNAHGWFMTGDLGWLDVQGYLHITGRKKDLIIRGGHNIYPARIENLAMQHEAIERAAAFPVPDVRLGEKVCIAVMLRAGHRLSPDELLAHLDAAGLSRYDMPEYFLALDEIPLTASGKVFKHALVQSVRDGRMVPTPIRWHAKLGES